jgi:hypothetical protein
MLKVRRPDSTESPLVLLAVLAAFGLVAQAAQSQVVLGKLSTGLSEVMLGGAGSGVPVWVEFTDRPLAREPSRYLKATARGSYLPPMNDEYTRAVLGLPGVEFLGASELTNEVGLLLPASALGELAAFTFVRYVEEMPMLVLDRSGEYFPPYGAYQSTYYNATALRALQDSFSGYDPVLVRGDTLGRHMKIAVLDDGVEGHHPAFWNSNIRLTPNDSVARDQSLAARDSFVHLAYLKVATGGYELRCKHSLDYGINWSVPRTVWQGNLSSVDIGTVGDNVYIVANAVDGSNTQVHFWRSTDNGTNWEGPQVLTSYAPGEALPQWPPRVAGQGSAVYVVWGEYQFLSNEPYMWFWVRFRRSLSRGAAGTWLAMQTIADCDTSLTARPDVEASPTGADVHVTWAQRYPDRVRYRRSADQGASWTPYELAAGGSVYSVAVAVGSNLGHVGYVRYDAGGSADVHYWRPVGDITTQLSTLGTAMHCAAAAAGRFVYVVWEDTRTGVPQVFLKRHRDLGSGAVPWDDADGFAGNDTADGVKRVSFSPDSTQCKVVAAAATDSGTAHMRMVHVSWLDNRNTAPGVLDEVYYASSSKISDWRDFRTPANRCPREYGDDDHGTNVSSIAAGALVGRTGGTAFNPFVGVAWQSALAVANVTSGTPGDSIYEARAIRAFKWAVDTIGADVVNTSFGYPSAMTPTADSGTRRITQYVDWVVARGKVLTKSAGNIGYLGAGSITAPGDNFNAMTVGATTLNGSAVWDTSSRGPAADGRIKPDLVAPGVATYVATLGDSWSNLWSGTSFASPTVGGISALLLQSHPTWTPGAVRRALLSTAAPVTGNPRPNNDEGWGQVQAWAANTQNLTNFPPAILPTAIPYPQDSLSRQRGDSVELWVLVKERDAAPAVRINLSAIGGAADRPMSGTWVPDMWVVYRCTAYVDTGVALGRKYLKATAAQAGDTVRAYVNLTVTPAVGLQQPAELTAGPVLAEVRPNPARGAALLRYLVGQEGLVRVEVFDADGRRAATLLDARVSPGVRELRWDGRDRRGRRLSPGVYFMRVTASGVSASRKLVLARP